jgi:hypothetical protein
MISFSPFFSIPTINLFYSQRFKLEATTPAILERIPRLNHKFKETLSAWLISLRNWFLSVVLKCLLALIKLSS